MLTVSWYIHSLWILGFMAEEQNLLLCVRVAFSWNNNVNSCQLMERENTMELISL